MLKKVGSVGRVSVCKVVSLRRYTSGEIDGVVAVMYLRCFLMGGVLCVVYLNSEKIR